MAGDWAKSLSFSDRLTETSKMQVSVVRRFGPRRMAQVPESAVMRSMS